MVEGHWRMVVGASLIPTVEALWQEALQCSGLDPSDIENAPLHANTPDMNDGWRPDFARIERAFRCLYAGLELVLPVQFEIRFRLLLARILQTYTKNGIEACEHLRKALVLVQSVCRWLLVPFDSLESRLSIGTTATDNFELVQQRNSLK